MTAEAPVANTGAPALVVHSCSLVCDCSLRGGGGLCVALTSWNHLYAVHLLKLAQENLGHF